MVLHNSKSQALTLALRFIVNNLHLSLRHIELVHCLHRATLSKILKGEKDTSRSYERYMPVFAKIIEMQRRWFEDSLQKQLSLRCIYLFASLFLLQFGIMLLLGR